MPDSHFDEMIPAIFDNAKWFLKQYQAFIMIGTAIALAMTLLILISNLFIRPNKKRDDDDDWYDLEEY